ncbi:hypothetical protein M6B38_108620 [Iris pallida]|uniref:Uncharacterized protein n=1 Tax=Iris pallida TaxID=29817 RepID=A0AAX6EBS8_IRIPA|nr:hypothetical protein M6B38_197815 [Iris pallida]KAJ6803423.1 hypothetical protein M6B38_108620 [Iris pallida]
MSAWRWFVFEFWCKFVLCPDRVREVHTCSGRDFSSELAWMWDVQVCIKLGVPVSISYSIWLIIYVS